MSGGSLLAGFDDFGCHSSLTTSLHLRFAERREIQLCRQRPAYRAAGLDTKCVCAVAYRSMASGNRYRFPVSVDSGALFDRSRVMKMSGIVTAPDGRMIDVVHFPSGLQKRVEVLREIAG